jgi:hypothetical protein
MLILSINRIECILHSISMTHGSLTVNFAEYLKDYAACIYLMVGNCASRVFILGYILSLIFFVLFYFNVRMLIQFTMDF